MIGLPGRPGGPMLTESHSTMSSSTFFSVMLRATPRRRALGLAALAALPSLAWAQSYTLVNLGNLYSSSPYATATAVNNAGVVVGTSKYDSSHYHAFSWSSGTLTDLGALAGTTSYGYGLNDSGAVVGQSNGKAYVKIGATWVDLTTPDTGFATSGQANGVNGGGAVVGYNSNGTTVNAFVYSGGLSGSFTNLGTLGGWYSQANAINSGGTVVGYSYVTGDAASHAFVNPAGGAMQDLGVFGAGATNSSARAINTAGTIVGNSDNGAGVSYAGYFDGSVWHDLGNLGVNSAYAYGINSSGVIVGSSTEGTFYQTHAFAYTSGAMVDLNTLVDPTSAGFLYLQSARAINDSGWIVGDAMTSTSGNGAFLLIPTAIPEPGTYPALLGAGALVFALWRRRK